jgi:hypothetical protein
VRDEDASPGPSNAAPQDSPSGPRSRSEAKDAAARARLEPLREGERPTAVTVAAVVALALGAGNLIAFAAGATVNGERPSAVFVVGQSAVLLVAGAGMWRARYWAVLGMQALLALLILFVALFLLMVASTAIQILLGGLVLAGASALFWFLVRAMARLQMPERR